MASPSALGLPNINHSSHNTSRLERKDQYLSPMLHVSSLWGEAFAKPFGTFGTFRKLYSKKLEASCDCLHRMSCTIATPMSQYSCMNNINPCN